MARYDRSLKRRAARREPARRFILFCEGEKTEPAYFDALRRSIGNALVEVTAIHAGVPMTIAGRAVERARRRKGKDSFEQHDQVWAVFDRDEHPNYEDATRLCEQHKVRVARSNPCFEVWLILHEEDYQRPDDRHQAQAHLRKLRPEYDPAGSKTCNFREMIARIEHAEERARRQLQLREEEGPPFAPPSTTVGHLTEAIRKAAKEAAGDA